MKRSELLATFEDYKQRITSQILSKPLYACGVFFILGCLSVVLFKLVVVVLFMALVICGVAWFLAEPDEPMSSNDSNTPDNSASL